MGHIFIVRMAWSWSLLTIVQFRKLLFPVRLQASFFKGKIIIIALRLDGFTCNDHPKT